MRKRSFRPTPAMVVALLALTVALGGTAFAAAKIGTSDIKNNAVTSKKIKKKAVTSSRIDKQAVTGNRLAKNAVKAAKIQEGAVKGAKILDGAVGTDKLSDGAVTGPKVADDTLSDAKISDYKVFGKDLDPVTATEGATAAAARTAAPEIPIYTKGALTIYAKCFRDTVLDTTYGEIYVRTSQDRSIMEGTDDLAGGAAAGDWLNTSTPEVDRQLDTQLVTGNDAFYDEAEGQAAAPDGTRLSLVTGIGVKNGATAGDGPYGQGNGCIFQGAAFG